MFLRTENLSQELVAAVQGDAVGPSFKPDEEIFFEVGEARYVAWPTSQVRLGMRTTGNPIIDQTDTVESPPAVFGTGFLTVLPWDGSDTVGTENLETMLDAWLEADDVLVPMFLEQVILKCADSTKLILSPDALDTFKKYGTRNVECVSSSHSLAEGPYILVGQRLLEIHRLYDDTWRTFITTFQQMDGNEIRFRTLNDGRHGWDCCSVAVPSRLKTQQSPSKPFGAYRIALKDAFDLEGIRTSMGNRGYLDLYPPAKSSAPCLRPILDGGGKILGKTKLSMFLSREEPSESVDFQTPWNPRGDRYQGPGGSSSGSAAAVGAYDWVDIGIGTDTNGSIRRPAQCNGCFGLRPSRGALSSEQMFTVFKHFDVPGIFARDYSKLVDFASSWYAKTFSQEPEDLPVALIYPSDLYPPESTPQHDVIEKVVADFERFLNVKADRRSVTTAWRENPPAEAKGEDLRDYLQKVGAASFLYSNYHAGEKFREDYKAKYGHAPFVSRFVHWRWSVGVKVSEAEHQQAMYRMHVYEQWFLTEMLQVGKTNTLLVMQSEDVKPNYRDDPPPCVFLNHRLRLPLIFPSGEYYVQPVWHQWWVSSVLGAPELIVPNRVYLAHLRADRVPPVTAAILSQPGTDMFLMRLVDTFLATSQRPRVLKAGKEMFDRHGPFSETLKAKGVNGASSQATSLAIVPSRDVSDVD